MIAILGGGITAIAAAVELKKQGKDFILIEKSNRLGGKIQSATLEGYHLEFGPNTVLINHPETKAFLEYLNLYDKRLQPDAQAIKKRFVLKKGKIEPIPYSFGSLLKSKLFGLSTIFSMLKEPSKRAKKSKEEESLADFSRRRFGTQIYDDLITPFVSGIYAGDPEKMSLRYTMPLLHQAEQKFGSVVKGMPKLIKEKRESQSAYNMPKQKIFSFEKGLQSMVDVAAKKIKDELSLNTEIKSIETSEEKYVLKLSNAEGDLEMSVDQLICTLPAHRLVTILSFDSSFKSAIKQVNYVPAGVRDLVFPKSRWRFKRKAFGLLSRKAESEPWLGILFNSEFFPQQQRTDDILLTVISGGYRQTDFINLSDQEILKKLNESINRIGLANGEAAFHHIYRWEKAIPQYEVGYAELEAEMKRFEKENPRIKIAGNYYKGVSVSDCIANGTKLAREI